MGSIRRIWAVSERRLVVIGFWGLGDGLSPLLIRKTDLFRAFTVFSILKGPLLDPDVILGVLCGFLEGRECVWYLRPDLVDPIFWSPADSL